jgi:hypothetical protein
MGQISLTKPPCAARTTRGITRRVRVPRSPHGLPRHRTLAPGGGACVRQHRPSSHRPRIARPPLACGIPVPGRMGKVAYLQLGDCHSRGASARIPTCYPCGHHAVNAFTFAAADGGIAEPCVRKFFARSYRGSIPTAAPPRARDRALRQAVPVRCRLHGGTGVENLTRLVAEWVEKDVGARPAPLTNSGDSVAHSMRLQTASRCRAGGGAFRRISISPQVAARPLPSFPEIGIVLDDDGRSLGSGLFRFARCHVTPAPPLTESRLQAAFLLPELLARKPCR